MNAKDRTRATRLPATRPQDGQGLVDYGLMLGLTGVFTAIILGVFGGTVAEVLRFIGNAVDAATGG